MKITYWLLLIYPALLIIVTFYGSKFEKNRNGDREFLSLKQTQAMQAFSCMGVIIHHITQRITQYGEVKKGPITIFANVGFLFTALFFFCSGYGLIVSIYNKKEYLRNFLSHRLSRVLIPFVSANFIYIIVLAIVNGRVDSFDNNVRYLFGFILINSNGWFIIEITVLYIAFFAFFRLVRNKDLALGMLIAFTMGLILYAKHRGHDTNMIHVNGAWFKGEWWYNSTFIFVVGMIAARFRVKIDLVLRKFYAPVFAVFALLLVPAYFYEEKIRLLYGYYRESSKIDGISNSTVTLLAQSLLCLVWVLFVILLNYTISFSNVVLSFISSISMEIFLIHKLFLEGVFANVRFSDFTIFPAVIITSLISAWILAHINKKIFIIASEVIARNSDRVNGFFGYLVARGMDYIGCKLPNKSISKLKILCSVFAGAVLGVALAFNITGLIRTSGEIRKLRECQVGDVVDYGKYDLNESFGKERLDWIVLSKDDNSVTLITRQAISGGTYNQKHVEIDWVSSDIRKRLNGKGFLSAFNGSELKRIISEDGDRITLMTPAQAEIYFADDEARKVSSTDKAIAAGANTNARSKVNQWDFREGKTSWWWLRGTDNEKSIFAPTVSVDGKIEFEHEYVNRPAGAIRPIITVYIGK